MSNACKILLRITAALWLACSFRAAAEVPEAEREPLRRYLQAYESLSTAEWLSERDMPEEADDMLREALRLFRALTQLHPQWQPELVRHRIRQCEEQLASGRAAGAASAAPSPSAAPAPPPAQPRPVNIAEQARNTARLRQAVQLERVADLRGAAEIYREILKTAPRSLTALQGLARIYLRLDRMDLAREILRRAEDLPELDENTMLLRVYVLCHDLEFDRARSILDNLLKRNPWNPHAHLAMATVHSHYGQWSAAAESAKRAISLNPKLGEAYYNLALISLRQTPLDIDVTRTHYNNALRFGAGRDPRLETLLE